jgi:hypothetical protein
MSTTHPRAIKSEPVPNDSETDRVFSVEVGGRHTIGRAATRLVQGNVLITILGAEVCMMGNGQQLFRSAHPDSVAVFRHIIDLLAGIGIEG